MEEGLEENQVSIETYENHFDFNDFPLFDSDKVVDAEPSKLEVFRYKLLQILTPL